MTNDHQRRLSTYILYALFTTMQVRHAELADIDTLCAIDHSYVTEYVWQLNARDTTEEFSSQFRLARLPRQIQVNGPHDARVLRRNLHRCDHVWVMQGEATRDAPRGILGYLGMATLPWQNTGWVPVCAVVPEFRRKGIGSQLLRAAMSQAKQDSLHSITLDVQTKNYPAIQVLQSRGFRYSGYADNFYSTHDIALFFAYRIR